MTNRPLPGRRSSPATGTIRRSIRRTAPAVILLCFAAALAATPAVGDPSIAANFVELRRVTSELADVDTALAATEDAWLDIEERAP